MKNGVLIDYKTLRKINPQTARLAVLEYLKSNGNNVSDAARVFNIQRRIVYKALEKKWQGNLSDSSRTPHIQPRKTSNAVEQKVIEAKNKTHLGQKRLSIYLGKYENTTVPYGTIRHILRRNKDQMTHLDRYNILNYQWGALDVKSRFKLIGYSREKTWTNGLLWYLWVIAYLRSHGATEEIIFTVDHGEELGGKSWIKIKELRRLIAGFGCRLIQNHKGHCEENAHLERSHRTDDDEFYIPRILNIKKQGLKPMRQPTITLQ